MDDDGFGRGMEDALEIQRRFNAIHNMMVEYMRRAFSSSSKCPCGNELSGHCVLCGACVGGECGASHVSAPKFGYAVLPDALDSEIVYDDILDAEVVE